MSTLPNVDTESIIKGAENDSPSSCEKASLTLPTPLAPVNQATETVLLSTAIAGH